MKILIMPSSLEQAKTLGDGVIVGIKGLSVNCPCYFDVSDLKEINKDIFVTLNKNIHNNNLEHLKDVLIKLNDLNIKGVIFYDLSILNLKDKLNLNYDLIWHQEHMTTNYKTVNLMYDLGVSYAYLSSDITLREMLEIKNNTDSKLFINGFGYQPMFASRRNLVKNYLNTFNLKSDDNLMISKEGKRYYIEDDSNGTFVYTNFILEGLKESLNFDYVVLNSYKIDNFSKVVEIFKNTTNDNLVENEAKLYELFNNLGKGFFYEGTVYKVK